MSEPELRRWYLAELIVAIRVEGDEEYSVQFSMHLVEAGSASEAYEKAMRIGHLQQKSYLRRDGALVEFQFQGLNELAPVEGELEDGARLLLRTEHGWTGDQVLECITPREKLRAVEEEGIAGGGDTIQ